ncbi:MAG: hypothetical protein JWL60_1502 [Gemmatimonadetes bacterium]|jgi:hypothetical protein|nr:hypothetical protein [Gemmatimonadota bacterium]
MRPLLFVASALLLAAGLVLGYIALIAARRSEGVFLPAGYVAAACLAAAYFIGRAAMRP